MSWFDRVLHAALNGILRGCFLCLFLFLLVAVLRPHVAHQSPLHLADCILSAICWFALFGPCLSRNGQGILCGAERIQNGGFP